MFTLSFRLFMDARNSTHGTNGNQLRPDMYRVISQFSISRTDDNSHSLPTTLLSHHVFIVFHFVSNIQLFLLFI